MHQHYCLTSWWCRVSFFLYTSVVHIIETGWCLIFAKWGYVSDRFSHSYTLLLLRVYKLGDTATLWKEVLIVNANLLLGFMESSSRGMTSGMVVMRKKTHQRNLHCHFVLPLAAPVEDGTKWSGSQFKGSLVRIFNLKYTHITANHRVELRGKSAIVPLEGCPLWPK